MGHDFYMRRCLDLAQQGAGFVAPNPMVGAVLLYQDHIIGEGYHQKYGEAHAEVNCINQAIEHGYTDKLDQSTLYVSLEPCTHFGKTPPCADLIINRGIQKVVIGCRDAFEEVDGKGIEKLKNAGVEVEVGILENECKELNNRFFTFHKQLRPFIILKWAQTNNGKIATGNHERLLISNEYSNRLVHKWRSEEAAILVGTNTAKLDNPELTTRLWPGNSPVRLVIDMGLQLPSSLKLFDNKTQTIIFNTIKHEEEGNLLYYQVIPDENLVRQVINALYSLKIQSVIIEGGARLLQSFIDEGIWDEVRVIKNEQLMVSSGLDAPILKNAKKTFRQKIFSDIIEIYKQDNPG